MAKIAIYLIDDQTMMRAALRALLQQMEPFDVVGDSGDPAEAVEQIARVRPDVVVLDVARPGLDADELLPEIKRVAPAARVLVVTRHEGQSIVRRSFEAGADGYVAKDSEPEELGLAIEWLCRGERYLSPRVAGAQRIARSERRIASLTPREREVLRLLALGKANKEVAAALHVAVGTVRKHRENLQRKLDCHSSAELARMAIREGILSV